MAAHDDEEKLAHVLTRTEEPPPVEIDVTSVSDTDSALGDIDSSTLSTSLKSSIFNYRYENGRRYHAFKDGAYLNPDDEIEQERLDLLHHLFRMMLGGALYISPLEVEPINILDIGTGTGIWAIDVADEHPQARVIGTDLSTMQPTLVPPNCQFYVDDAETDWVFDTRFDFIHARCMCGAIADWPRLYAQVLANLSPGGWFEIQDFASWIRSDDDTIQRSKWAVDWNNEILKATEAFGKPMAIVHLHKERMVKAGFVNVTEKIVKVPIGDWARDKKLKGMGQIEQVQMTEAVDAFTPAMYTRVLGYSWDQTQVIMNGVKREFADRKNHWYITYHFICGQRPG